jgi:serine/threonine protein kinase
MQRAAHQDNVNGLFNMLQLNGASEDLVDLLKHMLVINPSERYSMYQVHHSCIPALTSCVLPMTEILLPTDRLEQPFGRHHGYHSDSWNQDYPTLGAMIPKFLTLPHARQASTPSALKTEV